MHLQAHCGICTLQQGTLSSYSCASWLIPAYLAQIGMHAAAG